MSTGIYAICNFEYFIDPPRPLPANALADPLGGPGWWVDGDVAHLVEWLAADETLVPGVRLVRLEFTECDLRRLIRYSRLLVIQVVTSANGDHEPGVVAALRVDRLVVVGPSAAWHARLLRRVQEACQMQAEWLPVVTADAESYVIQTTQI